MRNSTFWNNPPWANGKGGYQMGLTPLELSDWCKQAITPEQRATKLALLRTNFSDVVQTTATSLPAQRLLASHVNAIHHNSRDHLVKETKDAVSPEDLSAARPLINAALCVPDDLCLLERHNNHYQLVAGCVTAPSYWRLADKLGKTLTAVHATVPGLNDQLGERMNTLFTSLPNNRCLSRRNWFLHGSHELFQPNPEIRTRITQASDAATLTVRSETQTLRRLSDEVIAFTIAVDCYPLREIVSYPHAARAMHSALTSRNELERIAASQQTYETGVLALLEHCAQPN